MAWADVAAKIKFWGPDGTPLTINGVSVSSYGGVSQFSKAQKDEILAALQELYDNPNSITAHALLDAGAAAGDIWLANHTGFGSSSFPGSRTAVIDFDQVNSLEWMGRDGQFHKDHLGGNVIHQLIHAIDGTYDLLDPTTHLPANTRDYNNPIFDHLGLTIRKQNIIFHEMGWGDGYQQVGYNATFDVNSALLRNDISYTEGETIDIAYFDSSLNSTENTLDLSRRADQSNDLIIGSRATT